MAKARASLRGLGIESYFSAPIGDPYKDPKNIIKYAPRDVKITDDSGKVIEEIKGAIFPVEWTQHAANTTATKYFRREDVPETFREIDIRQLASRVARKITLWGMEQGYFGKDDAKTLEYELAAATLGQYAAFNSPVWFNLGLDLYGIRHFGEISYHMAQNGKIVREKDFYKNPIVSACFIVSPEDSIESMVEVAGVISARIFKGGSGIGGDWSKVRSSGEPVSGGGYASGSVRFQDFQDAVGRVIKSGGKTRRAATMQSSSARHPDIEEILKHKFKEEEKARVLIAAGSPSTWESHTIQDLRAQNVNISMRTDHDFWEAYEKDSMYQIKRVKDNKVVREVRARDLAKIMAFTTYYCGDPGIQNHDTINEWNTCKKSGEIWASNPCSEYMFLDRSACNLASLNLLRFRQTDGTFDLDSFCRAVDLYITSQDILVSRASYPTKEIARNSDIFRPLGLGYANLGAYIMSLGLAYDSDEARDFAAAVTSLMTAEAYLQSTKLAEKLGTFKEFEKNKDCMLEVIEKHRTYSKKIPVRKGLETIVESANKKWDDVIERGNAYGFRNAQVTLLAPTGTIGYMMGCDTTGCEPELALKKRKELAGGGTMYIVNQTVPLALEKLGYDKDTISKITDYIDKNETVEGCPELNEQHLSVFDCSVCSGEGVRFIAPMGHIRMLSAIQPFISGAISKTVNCPSNTTVEEIESMFYQGWKRGLKAVAIYRDSSKAAQPLTTKKAGKLEILIRGQREPLPANRIGMIQKVRIGEVPLFLIAGEYADGRLGELFIDSLERGSEVNRLLNENAIQFSEKLQYGIPLREAIDIFRKAGKSQISGQTDHPFITDVRGVEGFIYDWLRSHHLGDISFVEKEPERRPLPWELRVYQQVPKLHLIPSIAGRTMYPGVPTLEETIIKISGMNYWQDEGLDTRQTIEKIKRTRVWGSESASEKTVYGKLTGATCINCGTMLEVNGNCWICPTCMISTGGCGGG